MFFLRPSMGLAVAIALLKVPYDPAVVSYEKLLTAFWHNIDPMNRRGQFCDKGRQYRSAIFYTSAQQKELAEASKEAGKQRLRRPIAPSPRRLWKPPSSTAPKSINRTTTLRTL